MLSESDSSFDSYSSVDSKNIKDYEAKYKAIFKENEVDR